MTTGKKSLDRKKVDREVSEAFYEWIEKAAGLYRDAGFSFAEGIDHICYVMLTSVAGSIVIYGNGDAQAGIHATLDKAIEMARKERRQ